MMFQMTYSRGMPPPPSLIQHQQYQQPRQQQQQQQEQAIRAASTMTWGPPTWLLLHTLAQKVKDDAYPLIRQELNDLVIRICTNLPCPMCANHAMEYLQKINFNAIQTKKDLKDLIFQFHNAVNLRKSYAPFSYAQLDAKYNTAITQNVVQHFLASFQQSHNNGAQINVNTFSKNRAIQYMQSWFRKNLQYFDT
jgi:hypothetical protein